MRVIDAAHFDTLHTVYSPCLGDGQLFDEAANLLNTRNLFSLPNEKKIDKKKTRVASRLLKKLRSNCRASILQAFC